MTNPSDRERPEGQTSGSDQRPGRAVSGSALRFDLPEQIRLLKSETGWKTNDRQAKTLLQEKPYRVVLTALKSGTVIKEHRALGWTTVQTLEGHVKVRFATGDVADLPAGALLAMEPNLAHDVEAIEESVFLLSIGLGANQA
jgi:quercetin dioxygenase-like cupin family protein